MTTILQTLRYARDLVSKPNGWTQRTAARDKRGSAVHPYMREAVCFCVTGAIDAASYRLCEEVGGATALFRKTIKHLKVVKPGLDLPIWNDMTRRTQKDVVDMLDDVIVITEERCHP